MKTWITVMAILAMLSVSQLADAQTVPSWIKSNADFWVQEQISDEVFVQGIEYLISEGIMHVSVTQETQESSEGIPDWVRNVAEFWVDGSIEDSEFLGGIQYLVEVGIIVVGAQEHEDTGSEDARLAELEGELLACEDIKKAAKRSDCRKAAQHAVTVYKYKAEAQLIHAGPINFYWNGIGSEGSDLEISPTGQAILTIRMLAENTDSENVALQCTSPQICSYDVWNGDTAFKYAGTDFTNGQIVLKPGQAKEFNMLFGPDIGYGGTQFIYDSSKDYYFRISEHWGSAEVPLGLD